MVVCFVIRRNAKLQDKTYKINWKKYMQVYDLKIQTLMNKAVQYFFFYSTVIQLVRYNNNMKTSIAPKSS